MSSWREAHHTLIVQRRTRRMAAYSVSLAAGFLPLMPFERASREFHVALLASCAIFIAGGLCVIRGERDATRRPMWALKLLAAAWVTTVAAALVLLLTVAWLISG
jgi:hypothetical protein